MDLSICILTHNQPLLLPRCVAACLAEIAKTGLAAEVLIVDNASSDAYPQRLSALSPLIRTLRNEENLGFSAANNRAIRASRGRYVLILNDDALLDEGSLRLMFQRLDSSPHVGVVGPRFLNADGSLQRGFTNACFPHLRHIVCQILMLERLLERNAWTRDALTVCRNPEESGEAEHLAGACLLARREALDAIGLFDEGYYYFSEDVDLCYRLRKAGWGVVYLAEARVTHYGSASFNELGRSERSAIYFNSLLYYFKKHSSRAKYILVRLTLGFVLFLSIFERALLGIMRRRLTNEQVGDKMRANLRLLRSVLRNGHSPRGA
jgi:GT2 family glycosyltransferase